jgi:flagellar biosynthesis anti-sigma factor FlgM
MNINGINTSRSVTADKVQKDSSNKTFVATPTPEARHQSSQDKVTTSSTVESLTRAALEPVPARQAKVNALKQAVKEGQYQPDARKIADSLAKATV